MELNSSKLSNSRWVFTCSCLIYFSSKTDKFIDLFADDLDWIPNIVEQGSNPPAIEELFTFCIIGKRIEDLSKFTAIKSSPEICVLGVDERPRRKTLTEWT